MLNFPLTKAQITSFLKEDVKDGDATTNAIPIIAKMTSHFHIISKNSTPFTLSGVSSLTKVLEVIAKKPFKIEILKQDGESVEKGDIIIKGEASADEFLIAERISLNLMQQLSGVATKTANYIKALGSTKIKILDTRKTIPGMRELQKYAVKCGGGENHRFGLYDMIMIKDNHIAAALGIENAITAVIKANFKNLKIEVECENLEQVRKAINFPINRIMLDNMPVLEMIEASKIIRHASKKIEIEVSGGVNLTNIHALRSLDIDYISIGDLTHSINSVDISARIK